MGKYSDLGTFLSNIKDKDKIILDFPRIEKIINKPLPKSAYSHNAWWSNSKSHSHTKTWLDVGWLVDKPKSAIKNRQVIFVRNKDINDESKKEKLPYDFYVKQYHFLSQMVLENQENFEKTILTLSSSFLALSVSLLGFFKDSEIIYMNYLFSCWGCFFSSILLILINFKFSEVSLNKDIEDLEKLLEGIEQVPEKGKFDFVEFIYLISGILFLIGIILLMRFYSFQIS